MSRRSESMRKEAQKCRNKFEDLVDRADLESRKAEALERAADILEGKTDDADPDRTP